MKKKKLLQNQWCILFEILQAASFMSTCLSLLILCTLAYICPHHKPNWIISADQRDLMYGEMSKSSNSFIFWNSWADQNLLFVGSSDKGRMKIYVNNYNCLSRKDNYFKAQKVSSSVVLKLCRQYHTTLPLKLQKIYVVSHMSVPWIF